MALIGFNQGAFNQVAPPEWTVQNGTYTTNYKDVVPYAATLDASDNLFITGLTTGNYDGNTIIGSQDCFITKYNSSNVKQWTITNGISGGNCAGFGISVDSAGNIYITGNTNGNLNSQTKSGYTDYFISKFNSTGVLQWTKLLGKSTKTTYGRAVIVDSSFNVFVSGYTSGGLSTNTQVGTVDYFISKYDSSGNLLWVKQSGVASVYTYGYGIALDSTGNAYVSGQTFGALNGTSLIGTSDAFIVKYDTSGNLLTTKHIGASSLTTSGYNLVIDTTTNDIYVGGLTQANLTTGVSNGLINTFIEKYDSNLSLQWISQNGVTGTMNLGPFFRDSSGNLYSTGSINAAFSGNTQSGTYDFFVRKINSSGAEQWVKQLGVSSYTLTSSSVVANSSGNVFVIGYTPVGLSGNTVLAGNDLYIANYSSIGVLNSVTDLYARTETAGNTIPLNMISDSLGNTYVVGYTSGHLDSNTLKGITQADMFVSKYNSKGVKLWTQLFGATSVLTQAYSIILDSSGNIFISGTTAGNLNSVTKTGTADAFIMKLDSTGSHLWTKLLGATSGTVYGTQIAFDSAQNIFLVGNTNVGLNGNTQSGTIDYFVAKYDYSGNLISVKQSGVSGKTAKALSLTLDSLNNILVCGYSTGGLHGNTQIGTNDFILIKFDNNLSSVAWARQVGIASGTTYCNGVVSDSSNNIYITGTTNKGLGGNTQVGTYDIYFSKFSSDGTSQYYIQKGTASKTINISNMTKDSLGNLYTIGYIANGSFDGNAAIGSYDAILTKITMSGSWQWTKKMGASSKTIAGYGVSVDNLGSVFISGQTNGSLDQQTLNGAIDLFLSKYIGN
jgi:hypothetical protein